MISAVLCLTALTCSPAKAKVDALLLRTGEIRVRVANAGTSPLLVARYSFAWEARLFRDGKQISEQVAYLKGGSRNGGEYYPPQLIVPTDIDWLLLRPADEVQFNLWANSFDGRAIKARAGDEVELRYDPEAVDMTRPAWDASGTYDELTGPILRSKTRLRIGGPSSRSLKKEALGG